MRYPENGRPEHGRLDILLFTGFLGLSLLLIALPPDRTSSVAGAVRRTALAPVLRFHGWMERRTEMRARLGELRRERAVLQRRLIRRQGIAEENRKLRRLLGLEERRAGSFLPAELLLGRPRLAEARRFQVDVGRTSGVEPPTGVVTADGLVGVLRSAGPRSSLGDLWSHPDFRVSVRTDTGAATGIARPARTGDGRGILVFEGAPYQRRVSPGTRLVTTGAGGVYPPGVLVGRVRSVASVESGWARSYRIEPAVRPGEVHFALVWKKPDGAAAGEQPAGAASDSSASPRAPPDTTGRGAG